MRSACSGCEDRSLDRRDRELPCRVAAYDVGDPRVPARGMRWRRPVCAVSGLSGHQVLAAWGQPILPA